MLSDEEREALERIDYIQDFIIENGQYNADVNDMEYFSRILNLIKKQSKEIEEYKEKNKDLDEKNFKYTIKIASLQTDVQEITKLINKNWEDKIKAKIEEVDYKMIAHQDVREAVKQVLNSLLEKEQ